MSNDLEIKVRITADGGLLVTRAREAKDSLNRLGETTRKINSESSSFTNQVTRQGTALDQATGKTQNLNTAQRASAEASARTVDAYNNQHGALTRLNGASLALTASLGAGVAAASMAFRGFVDFGRQLAGVSTLIEGTSEQMDALEASSRSLAADYGKMPVEQAKTFYQVISSGVTDVSKATELLDEANRLSVAGMADLFATADSMTSIMNAYGNKIKNAADVSDILFVGTLAGKATIDELASSLGRVAPIAESVGVDFDELTGAISALTLGGISTAESVTGVRAILAAVIKPSKEAIEVANALGIEFNSAALEAKGFGGFMADLVAKTHGSQEAMGLLFGGVEAIVPALALAGKAGDGYNSIMQQMADRTGATQTAFDKMAASPGFKVDQLMVSIKNAAITLGDTLAGYLIPAAEGATRALNNFLGVKKLSAIDQQKQNIEAMRAELESLGNRQHVPLIGNLIFDKKQADLLKQRIEDATTDLQKMQESARESANAGNAVTQSVKNETEAKVGLAKVNQILAGLQEKNTQKTKESTNTHEREAKQAVEKSQRIIDAFRRETQEVGLSTIQKRMLAAATEAANAPTEALRKEIMASAAAWAIATQREEENIATKKRQAEAADELARREKQAAEQTQRYWSSIWSDVEQTARMAFVQFASHGKSAMESIGESIKVAIFDVLYQLTIRKWMINIGASIGLGGSGMAMAGDIGGSGLLGNALSLGSIGTNLASMFKSGFGVPGFVGNLGSSLPGSIGSFFGGMAGKGATQLAAEAGAMSLWGASGASTGIAASMGSTLAAATGPAMIAFAVTQGLKALAGDKRMGGGFGNALNTIGDIPILGDFLPVIPLLNSLFGRGPLKQQGTLLSGEIGAEGFDSGYLQTRFKAKGGLFRSDKIDYARVDALTGQTWTDNDKLQGFADNLAKTAQEVFGLINDTTKQTSSSLRQIGQDLGVSTEGIDSFKHSINLLSEKGKMLTEEQIGAEIEKITDGLARSLLPQVDELSRRGETALQTVSRLGTEFNALVDAATMVLGKSAAEARAMIFGASFGGRTAFVDNAGGVDALNQKTQFFAANFLSDIERLVPAQENLNAELNRLGLSTDLTRTQFRDLVQSFGDLDGISESMLQSLLSLAPAFDAVRDAEESRAELIKNQRLGLEVQLLQLEGNTAELRKRELDALDPTNRALQERIWAIQDETAANQLFLTAINTRKAALTTEQQQLRGTLDGAFGALRRAVDAERKSVETHIDGITKNLEKLKSLSGALQNTLGRMSIANSAGEQRAAAQAQIATALVIARAGGVLPDAAALQRSLDVVAQPSADLYGSFVDYMRDFARTAADINSLDAIAQDQIGNQESALEIERSQLAYLDGLLNSAQAQIDALNGVDTTLMSIAQAMQGFNAAISNVKTNTAAINDAPAGLSSKVLGGTGNANITARDIVQYINSGVSPDQILAKALETGVSAQQVVAAMGGKQGYTLGNIRDFVKSKGLIPGFAAGGMHTGGLRIVGERGPELEYTPPSRIFNHSESQKLFDFSGIISGLNEIKAELIHIKKYTLQTTTLLDDVSAGGNAFLVEQS